MANLSPVQLSTGELYASKMTMTYRPNGRVLSPEIALRENPNAYELVQLDPSIRHAIDYATRQAVGHTYKLVAASDSPEDRELCAIYVELMREVENFLNARLSMAKNLMVLGEYYGYVNGERRRLNLAKKGVQNYWVPHEIRHISRDRVRKINRDDGTIQKLLFRPKSREWKELEGEQARCLLEMRNSDEENRFTQGQGLLDPLYIIYVAKKNAEGEMINLLERFGQGFTIVSIDESNDGSELRDLDALNTSYQDLFSTAKARHIAIIRKNDDVKVLDPSATGYDIIQKEIDRRATEALLMLLGSTLSVTQSQHGGYSASFVHAESASNHLRPTRVGIEELITFQLFRRVLYQLNYPQFVAVGLGSARPPRMEIPEDRRDDYEKNAKIIQTVQACGGVIKEDEFYELVGITQSVEGDKTIKPPLQNISSPVEPFKPVETQALVKMPKAGDEEGVKGEVSELNKSSEDSPPQPDGAKEQFTEEESPSHVMMDPQKFATEKLREFYTNPTRKNKFNALRAVELADKIKRGQAV